MFVSIRKYQNVRSVNEIRRLVEQEFVPILKQNPGFQSYSLIDSECPESGNIVISISIFDSWDAALESNVSAKAFVKDRLSELSPDPPDAFGGEVIFNVSREPLQA